MAKEICISSTPHETRLAILEDDQLAEIYYERENEYTLAGSIYNGRVTRVLPGMQSAFVDIGLERDAFLYVTDFLELEDQEESDELEKAAASNPNQPPREVHHGGDQNEQRPAQRPDGRQSDGRQDQQRQDRNARDRRPPAESAPLSAEAEFSAPQSLIISEQQQESGEESSDEHGAKRWRGRRRRRGGRGASGGPEGAPESGKSGPEANGAPEPVAPQEARPIPQPAPRAERAPAPFVLPGESLSRYGGALAESEQKSAAPSLPPARTLPSSRPSTLIEAPLAWDGSGLLPGESLSKHRGRQPEPDAERAPQPHEALDAADQIEEESFVEEMTESVESAPEAAQEVESQATTEDDTIEVIEEQLADVPHSEQTSIEYESAEPTSDAPAFSDSTTERDATASHHIDPSPPSGFRLFGLGGKKKKGDEPAAETPAAPSQTTTAVASVSTFAPGSGLVEEEVIEGEEFDAPGHHHHKGDEHDLDEYEEETLQNQIRSGELGEMLQEAHLDHRIQLDFDEKNGEEEEEDGEEEGEEPVVADGQPAGAPRPQRDRGGRGRRGRGGPGGQGQGNRRGPSRRSAQTSDLPIISDLLKPGQEILVQIAKEPIAKKGARITSHIALPGRFLVFMPTVSHVGVSRKISSDEERQRLKRILTSERGEASGGFIVRTAAEGASEEELRSDLRFLIHLWDEIKQRSESSKSPALIYHDLSLIERILRDQVSANFSSIWVDSQEDYERIVRFLNRFSPNLVRRVKLYTKETPLFEHFGIQDEISKALRSKVWLKSGGSIVINQTEALVAIDINTGKYVGKSARLEDTIVKTNLDAVPEIVRQIRLRDLGGIIIIDFIDMDERKNRFKVMAALEEALKSDRAPTKVLQFNDFGLVAITRKRVKQSLERTLSVPCPTCQATGMVKSPATVCNEIFTELRKMRKHFESADVLLRVNPETVKVLKSNNARWLTEFEELVGKNILVKSDATLHPEQFDIQG
jgi:Rne/Rng family ribonuclease